MSELEISIRRAEGHEDISIITLSGSVDGYTMLKFEQAINKLLNSNRYKLIIDCKGLNFISSAGVGVLIVAHCNLTPQNGDVKLINMNSEVYHTFELLGFSDVFHILKDEQEALKAFAGV